jgi:hypothetical protein
VGFWTQEEAMCIGYNGPGVDHAPGATG